MIFEPAITGVIIKTVTDIGIKVYEEMKDINVDDSFRKTFGIATKKYFQTYSGRHGQVQVLGMSKPVPLDAIYSGVRILDTESMKSYASQAELEKAYRDRGNRRFRHHDCSKRNGMDIANECERLIVLGDPGIGKSTFLRKVGLESLKGEQGSYRHKQIPVFLELKRLNSSDLSLEDRISNEFESCGFPSSEGFTKNALKKGQLLILFDGLDEVPADNLNTVIEKIQDLVDRYSDNRFIASCRIAAYHTYFKRVNTVAIAEFDDEQIKKFITNWFSSKLDQQSKTAEHCWELLQKPENKGAKELAQSPLLLTFLCMVYNKSLTVPSNRTALYGKALDIFLEEWASEKRVKREEIYSGFHSNLEKELLARVAINGFEKNQLFFSKDQLMEQITDFLNDALDAPLNLNASAVLEAIKVQQGIFVERATDIYSFSHLTLQEFLTAKHIVKWNLFDVVVKRHYASDRWREVFLLVSGLMGGAAINLLNILENQNIILSRNYKFKGILNWIKIQTKNSESNYIDFTGRILALILILSLSRTISRALSFSKASALEIALTRTNTHANASNLSNALSSASNNVRAISQQAGALGRASANALDKTLSHAHDLAITFDDSLNQNITPIVLEFAKERKLLENIDQQWLISQLDNTQQQVQSSVVEVLSLISLSLRIDSDFINLTVGDIDHITNYLKTCKLMIDCSKQASGISTQRWEKIKQRMLLISS